MDNSDMPTPLIGSDIHGFRTMEELDVANMMEEAKARWLRPNEIHAILCNHKHFTVNVKPVNLPKSGTIVLFDRKMLRNFRKDGHNWKKKKDGKTVKEAHEHLKVGNEERIHVYYAHGEDTPTFVRRCYWLLDKSLENIVLVHYRETQEQQGSPATPINSNSSSGVSDPSASWPLSEESESALDQMYYGDNRALLENPYTADIQNHEQRIHEINTLDWDELLVNEPHKLITPEEGKAVIYEQSNQFPTNSYIIDNNALSSKTVPGENSAIQQVSENNVINYNVSSNSSYACKTTGNSQTMISGMVPLSGTDLVNNLGKNGLQAQDSFGRWMSYIIADSPGSVDDTALEPSVSTENQSLTSSMDCPTGMGRIFNITDVSPSWALSTEETKILVVGVYNEGRLPSSELFVACGDSMLPVEVIQAGVLRCLIPPQAPRLANLFLTFDGHTPISQVLTFEFRAPAVPSAAISSDNKSNWEEFQYQMRLARLMCSSFKSLNLCSNVLPPNSLRDGKAFARRTSHISNDWAYLSKIVGDAKMCYSDAKDSLFEFTLQNLLREWLLEEVIAGCKVSERDEKGLGAIHLCAILGYTWSVYPFACSGLSLDYRDKSGWTALHWAAHYGREKMVAALLSAGAKPNLVSDPTPENPGGYTAADLASKNGFEGLAAYLAEKALVAQFNDMTLAGNVSGSLQTPNNDSVSPLHFNDDEMYLKDTLAAYRTAADAAARIQAAFREHSFKVRTKAVESSNPEIEARNIVAAMKIQHAFRNYDTRKKMAAAARIQYRFRTWRMRKDFLNMRRQAIKIQAVFRGFQVRKQYCKIVWSVGVLEKAILRWRLKRKGFRGLQVQSDVIIKDPDQESNVEEDFFQASRKQAEERVERSVVKVQAMFRSRRAQEEYRRMKLEHSKATLEYEGLLHPDIDMVQSNR